MKKQRLLTRRSWQNLRHFFYATPFYSLTLRRKVPKSLFALHADSWVGLEVADLGILSDAVSFFEPDGSIETAIACHSFNWLPELLIRGTIKSQARAKELVCQWLETQERWSEIPWRADVIGHRLSNWFLGQEYLLSSNDANFKNCFLKSLAQQAQHLIRIITSSPKDATIFPAIKGLIHSGICIPENSAALEAGLVLLGLELERQILPDGGHVQRSPSILLGVMRHLIHIRASLDGAQKETPLFLQGALDRMAPMLRSFRLGDGGLALFNGGNEEDPKIISQVLTKSKGRGKAISSAPHCGFQKITTGRAMLILDTGAPQSVVAAQEAHAGALSFEMSVGKKRLIVNCGHMASSDSGWCTAVRATAAHSTLCVDNANSSPLDPLCQPHNVTCTRQETDGNTWIESSHDGYKDSFGLVHERNLYLDSTGSNLRGEDVLTGFGGKAFVVRFHLHPQVKASLAGDGSMVLLKPSSGKGWRFRASGGVIALEESIYMGCPGSPQRSEQITVSGTLSGNGAHVKWAFNKES